MIREASIHTFEKIMRLIAEYRTRKQVCHTVGKIHGYVQVAVVFLVFKEEVQVVLIYIHFVDLSLARGLGSRPAVINPLFDNLKTSIIANSTGIFR